MSAAPDLLVLGSGGVLGDVWMTGVVCGLDRSSLVAPAASGAFLGTSAGSIVATRLASGQDIDTLIRRYVEPASVAAVPGPEPDLGTGDRRPRLFARLIAAHGATGRFARRLLLSIIPAGRQKLRHLERDMTALAPEWPNRLNIAAVEAGTGRRVCFSRGRNESLSVSEAVQASCAIPAVFQPVESRNGSGATYVDGGVWSPVNLDAVPAESGWTLLCLTPTGSDQGASGIGRRLVAWFFRTVVEGEVARLRRSGIRVVNVVPDEAA
ncbi:MAG: patatin-like phospholipase family protein, partial [Actinomycetota bacterium]|nr:patatin-like phospholipase family protein [Actinomycetota bacterium]